MLRLAFETICAMSAAGGILLLLISILRPVTIKAFSAAWNYYVSLIVVIFLLIPIGHIPGGIIGQFMDISPISVVPQTETMLISLDKIQDDMVKAITDRDIQQPYQRTQETFHVDDLINYLSYVWLLGMFIFIAYKATLFLQFKRKLLETSLPIEQDGNIYQVYKECSLDMGISQKIRLFSNDNIKTPMVIGLLRTCLIVPTVDMDNRELKYIFRHELIHCKRKDLWFKAVALLANALHWFNPLVYKLLYDINDFCEISCDEAVVRDMSMEERRFYGETILNVLSRVINKQEGIYSTFCESEQGIKRRLIFIMKKKSFSKRMITISIVMFIGVCIIGLSLAHVLVPSQLDKSATELTDKTESKPLFADIDSNNMTLEEKADQYELALEQFLAEFSQKQNTTIEEKEIEALTLPVPDGKITSPYGIRFHPVTGEYKLHTGIDYGQKEGADIVAANDGKVIATQKELGGIQYYGNCVIILHNDRTASLYAHCSALNVNTGDLVNKGDKIAEIGHTGKATGPHCHFEFRVNGKPVNPIPYIG